MIDDLTPEEEQTVPCPHPQCALERQMEYAIEIIVEGFNIFLHTEGWEPSDDLTAHLLGFKEMLNDIIVIEDADSPSSKSERFIIGDIQFPELGGQDESHS